MLRRSNTTSFGFLTAVAAVLACAAPAAADHPGGTMQSTVSESSISGVEATVERHTDPAAEFKDGANDATPPPGQATYSTALSASCPTVDRTVDDSQNSPLGATPAVKVLYVHPVNVGNRLGTYGPVIQAGAKSISDFVESESGGALSIRFDVGTFEGAECLDIQRIALSNTASYYSAPAAEAFSKVASEVFTRLGPQASKRNYLIYADMVAPSGIAGEAEAFIGTGHDTPAGAIHGNGGLFAMVYGRGGTDFMGSSTPFGPGQTSRYQLEVALHETTHNLGGVQNSAPHSSGAGHCNDQFDLMCYEDGGPGLLFQHPNCDGGATAPADPYGPGFQAWDCNKDDYFAVSPGVGTYLATHWNIANSVFLCAISACTPPDQQPPDTKITKEPNPKTTKRKVKIEFSATERSVLSCQLDGRPPKPCDSPYKVKVKRGRHTIRVGATDRVGLTDSTPAKTKFKVLKKLP